MRFLFFSFLCCLTISFAADKPVPLAPKGASSEDASGLELFADVALGHIDTGKRKRKLSSEQLEETKGEMPDAKKTRHSASPAPNASSSADDSFRTASKKRRPEEEELLESKRQTPSKKRRLTSPSSSSSGDLSLESDEEEAVFFPTEAPVDQVQEDVQEDLQEEISAIERLAKRALKEKKYFAKLEERAQISTEAQYQLARLLDETSDIKGRGDHIKPDLQRATDLYLSSIKTEHAPAISDLERLIVRKDILNYSNAKNFIKFVRKGIVREDKLLSLLKQFAVGKGSGGNSPTNVSRAIKDLTTFNVENNPLICSASVLLRCADTLVNERKRICECLTSGIDPRTGKKGISNVSKKLFDDSTYGDQRYKIDEMTGDLLHAAATAHEDRDAAWKFYVFCKSTPNYHRHENKMERIYPILLKEKEYFQAAEGYDYTKILNEAAETYLCSYFNGYASPDSRMAPKQLFALIQENLESLIKQVASSPAVGAEKEELLKNIFSNIEKLTRGLAQIGRAHV